MRNWEFDVKLVNFSSVRIDVRQQQRDAMNLGWGELLLIFAIILLIVGAKRLPEIGQSLGKSIREFQHSFQGDSDKDNKEKKDS